MIQLSRELAKLRYSSVARNAGWMTIGQGLGFLLQATYFVILARLLGVVEYGVYAGAFALTSVVAQYSPLGTGTVCLRYVSGDRSAFSAYWGNIILVTVGIGGLLTLALRLLS